MPATLKHGLFLLALIGGLALSWNQAPAPARFAASEYAFGTAPPSAALFETARIAPAADAPVVHSGTLAELSDGSLLAAWFAGSREGARDVTLQSARWHQGRWSPAQILLTRQQAAQELGRPLRKLGNPVLHRDAQQRLWLFFVGVSLGGWSTSSISYKISTDDGAHWTPARRLISSPFANISTLVRARALNYADNSIALPAYHELLGKFGELLRIDSTGRLIAKHRIGSAKTVIQPSLSASGPLHGTAFMRRTGNSPRRVMVSQTEDAGQHWSTPRALQLPNPDASVAVQRDARGHLLLVNNDLQRGRHRLSLFHSSNAQDWKRLRVLAQDATPEEFSYPFLLRMRNGDFHIIYTWKRSQMAHVHFNQSWLEQQP